MDTNKRKYESADAKNKKVTKVEQWMLDEDQVVLKPMVSLRGSLLPDPAKRGIIYCGERCVEIEHCLFGYQIYTCASTNDQAIYIATRPILDKAICEHDIIRTAVTKALICDSNGSKPPYYFDIRHGEDLTWAAVEHLQRKAAELYGNDGQIILSKSITPVLKMMANGLRRTVCCYVTPLLGNEVKAVRDFKFAVKNFAQEVSSRSPLAPIKASLLAALKVENLLLSGLNTTGPGLWIIGKNVYATCSDDLMPEPPARMPLRTEQALHVSLGDGGISADTIVMVVRLLKGEITREEDEEDVNDWSGVRGVSVIDAPTEIEDEVPRSEPSQHSDTSLLNDFIADNPCVDDAPPRTTLPSVVTPTQSSQSSNGVSSMDRVHHNMARLHAERVALRNQMDNASTPISKANSTSTPVTASTSTSATSNNATSTVTKEAAHATLPTQATTTTSTGSQSGDRTTDNKAQYVAPLHPRSRSSTNSAPHQAKTATVPISTAPTHSTTQTTSSTTQPSSPVPNVTTAAKSLPTWMEEMRDTRQVPPSVQSIRPDTLVTPAVSAHPATLVAPAVSARADTLVTPAVSAHPARKGTDWALSSGTDSAEEVELKETQRPDQRVSTDVTEKSHKQHSHTVAPAKPHTPPVQETVTPVIKPASTIRDGRWVKVKVAHVQQDSPGTAPAASAAGLAPKPSEQTNGNGTKNGTNTAHAAPHAAKKSPTRRKSTSPPNTNSNGTSSNTTANPTSTASTTTPPISTVTPAAVPTITEVDVKEEPNESSRFTVPVKNGNTSTITSNTTTTTNNTATTTNNTTTMSGMFSTAARPTTTSTVTHSTPAVHTTTQSQQTQHTSLPHHTATTTNSAPIQTRHDATGIEMYTNSAEATERLCDFLDLSLSEQLQREIHHLTQTTTVAVYRGTPRPTSLSAETTCVELNKEPLSVNEFHLAVRTQLGLL